MKDQNRNYTDSFPNDKQFDDLIEQKVCPKCGFKQNMYMEPPIILCQSCATLL